MKKVRQYLEGDAALGFILLSVFVAWQLGFLPI